MAAEGFGVTRDLQAEYAKKLTDENQGPIIALAELDKTSIERAKEYLKRK